MKYVTRDQTVTITAHEPIPEEPEVPEFRVKVSPVANGWWTRAEVTALRDKLSEALGGER